MACTIVTPAGHLNYCSYLWEGILPKPSGKDRAGEKDFERQDSVGRSVNVQAEWRQWGRGSRGACVAQGRQGKNTAVFFFLHIPLKIKSIRAP